MYRAGFVTGYFAALATVAAVGIKLAFTPPARWMWRR